MLKTNKHCSSRSVCDECFSLTETGSQADTVAPVEPSFCPGHVRSHHHTFAVFALWGWWTDRQTDWWRSRLLWKAMIELRTVNNECACACVWLKRRYLSCASDSAELSLEVRTAAVCQSEHPVGADLHFSAKQLENLRQLLSHSHTHGDYIAPFLHTEKLGNMTLATMKPLIMFSMSVIYNNSLTFLIPQFTSEPCPCLVGLSRTIPSRYSDSSSVLMWWGLSNGFSKPFGENQRNLFIFYLANLENGSCRNMS